MRNSYFGEKKLEESLRQMETKENMKKLAKALKNIWKQTEADVKSLEKAFPKIELPDKSAEIKPLEMEKSEMEPIVDKQVKSKDVKMNKLRII